MYKVYLDFETKSFLDIKKVGTHVYASDLSTDILCLAYADPRITLITPPFTGKAAYDLHRHALEPEAIFVAHNAAFEQDIWSEIMVKKYGYPEVPVERWRCTMAKAQACGLPASLEAVSKVLSSPFQKDMLGHKAMLKLSRPDKNGKFLTPVNSPDLFAALYKYCPSDVLAEIWLDGRLPELSPYEQRVWEFNEKINRSGVRIDVPLVKKVISLANTQKKLLEEEFKKITTGDFAPTQRIRFKAWLLEQGYDVPDTKAVTLEKLKGKNIEQPVRLFLASNKTSLAKYQAMLNRVSPDGKLRGIAAYHAAHTGRFGGRGVQLQNLPRTKYPMATLANVLNTSDWDWLQLLYSDTTSAMSSAIRGMFTPDIGFDFLIGDLSGIEARVLAWSAGESRRLQEFRQGVDPYVVAAKSIYPKGTKITKTERAVGKVAVLALGYQGGIGAFLKMADDYRVDLTPILNSLWETANYGEREACRADYLLYVKRCEKSASVPCDKLKGQVCSLIKTRWREANKNIVSFWALLEQAAIQAVRTKKPVRVADGRLSLFMHDLWLHVKLPSGRCIRYPYPKLDETARNTKLTYRTVDGLTKRWLRTSTYGGALTENLVQAISRDLFVENLLGIDSEYVEYELKFHVHDEAIVQISESRGSILEFTNALANCPNWANGLPVAAEAFRSKRYEKR